MDHCLQALIDIPVSLHRRIFHHVYRRVFYKCADTLAIVLATGLVVDDGIVVTENILRKWNMA
jgi:multidrug efflux pump